jgi:hypothetical protein
MPTEQTVKRPFHETIVEAIDRAYVTDLRCLAFLIKATKIPSNHDEIIAAWEKQLDRLLPLIHGDFDVPADLLGQKQRAAEEERTKAKKKKQAGTAPS